MRWGNKDVPRDEAYDAVRGSILAYMNQRSITPAMVAADTGYRREAVWRFLEGVDPNMALAQKIVYTYPHVGALDFICQYCGRLPRFWR